MLEDKTITRYISWSKLGPSDAIDIPDIEAFVANVMPKYFPEMNGVSIANTRLSHDLTSFIITVGEFPETTQ